MRTSSVRLFPRLPAPTSALRTPWLRLRPGAGAGTGAGVGARAIPLQSNQSRRYISGGDGRNCQAFEEHIKNVLKNSELAKESVHRLEMVDKPNARALLLHLVGDNIIGYASKKTTKLSPLPDFFIKEKTKHPDKVLLVRVGDFYETYGADAVLLVQHAGLNPMANWPRVGTQVQNIQATLDALTRADLMVAVYEEDRFQEEAGGKKPLKTRSLSQVVSPAMSTYTHNLHLRSDEIGFPRNRPVMGVMHSTQGYSVCEVHMDEGTVQLSELVTPEALRQSLLGACRECVYAIGFDRSVPASRTAFDQLKSFLPPHANIMRLPRDGRDFHEQVRAELGRRMGCEEDVSRFDVIRREHTDRPRPLYVATVRRGPVGVGGVGGVVLVVVVLAILILLK
jgi:hypothetical protein